ncbi:dipeptide ABC transporter ATP-binding protein [Uniformispora flossi]|uniref:dipeptide ABC transporter ATP-binding protein n=1 Tax=Uniformispora flossi TaxID=3390723 RepID=UPI003C2C047C
MSVPTNRHESATRDGTPPIPPVVSVSGLRVVFDTGSAASASGTGTDIVSDVAFDVAAGTILAIVGETGSGKTTAATALLGHARRGARIAAGRVTVDGLDVTTASSSALRALRGGRAAYVPQDPATALNPARRVHAHLDEVLRVHEPGLSRPERLERVESVLTEAGLPGGDPAFRRRFPHQLSGGQQQRVLLALAFVLRPKVVVLDEPTTALDVTTQARVLATVRELCRTHDTAAVYVSHDLAVVRSLADRVAVMYAGRVVEEAATADLFAAPRHPYTLGLLAAAPDVARHGRPTPIPGHAPAPGERPPGCAFAPRCPAATAVCRAERPESVPTGSGGTVACHHPVDGETAFTGLSAAGYASSAVGFPEGRAGVTDEPVLHARDVHVAYGDAAVLRGVSLTLRPGACTALVGESGAGKTTLARVLAGLDVPGRGDLSVRGASVPWPVESRDADVRRDVQYVFQNPYRALNPRLTVRRTLGAVVRHYFGTDRAETERRVLAALERVALPPRTADARPRDLSGGERQRVAVARALLAEPAVLICDEITSALDVSVQAGVLDVLARLRADGLATLFVTHDLGVVRAIADDVVVLHHGHVVERGPVDTVLDTPREDYTRTLVAAAPRLAATPARPVERVSP